MKDGFVTGATEGDRFVKKLTGSLRRRCRRRLRGLGALQRSVDTWIVRSRAFPGGELDLPALDQPQELVVALLLRGP